jgi:2-oxoglutarate dehydrogenase E2 component (dihydrolipoamide succinyltransferase)
MAYVTPLVRKLADERGVDLATVPGSGVGGRIRRDDVEKQAAKAEAERLAAEEAAKAEAERLAAEEAAKVGPKRGAAPEAGGAVFAGPGQDGVSVAGDGLATGGANSFGTAVLKADQPSPSAVGQPGLEAGPARASGKRGTVEPLSWQRSAMAERMVSSLRATAQVTATAEVDVTRISRLIDSARDSFREREGIDLTFLPFFVLAAVEALQANPSLNATLDGDKVRYHAVENVAFTVDTPLGPVTPVIKDAGATGLAGLARSIADLAGRIHENAVMPDELAGGTFTLTNPGTGDALFETPIVHEPQVAILSCGAVVKRPVVITDAAGNDAIALRSMAYLALSYDHRLVDGPDAGRFLSMVRARIESGAFDAAL